jgi:hypothetical protein
MPGRQSQWRMRLQAAQQLPPRRRRARAPNRDGNGPRGRRGKGLKCSQTGMTGLASGRGEVLVELRSVAAWCSGAKILCDVSLALGRDLRVHWPERRRQDDNPGGVSRSSCTDSGWSANARARLPIASGVPLVIGAMLLWRAARGRPPASKDAGQ